MSERAVESSAEIVLDASEKELIRVLHVDDDFSLLKVAKQCLEMQGPFQVDMASSADEALEKMKKEKYDAVVSDYQMSGKDGLEFLIELRQSGNRVPFMIFTGKGREEVAIRALNLGADQYLDKTGDPETVYCELGYAIRRTVERRKAQIALESLGERYRRLFESAVEGVVINGSDGRILSLNQAAANILGFSNPQELVGRPAVELYAEPESRARFLQELAEKGCAKDRELTWKKKDGTLINILASVTVQRDEKGNFLRTEGIIRDVTERKQAEKRLKESEEKFRTLFHEAMDAIFVADAETGILVDCNKAAMELVGRTQSELIGQHQRILHPETETKNERFSKTFQQHTGEREGQVLETQVITKTGEIKEVAIKGNIIELRGRKVLQGIFRDISEHKIAEESLRSCSQRYEKLFESQTIGVAISSPDGKISAANQAAARMLGYSGPKELVGLAFLESHVDQNQRKMMLEQLREKGYVQGFKAVLKRRDGTQVCIEANITLYKDTEGNVLRTESTFTEVPEDEKVEEELRESEERYRDLFESIQDPVGIFVGREGRLMNYNKAFKKSSGYADEELKGKVFLDFVHPDDRAMVSEKYHTKYSEDELPIVYEIRGLNKKGESIPLELSVSTYKRKGRVIGIVVIHRNIADRKKAERTILENQQNFKALFAGNPEAAVHVGPDFCILDVNPRFEMLFGCKLGEIKGKNINDVVVPKDKIDEAQMLDCRAKQDKHVSQDTVRRKKDGSLVPVLVSSAPITVEGRFLGYVAVYKDISELKNTQKKLEIMNEKLRVTGGLTRHDVRNKLSTVTGNVYLLKKRFADDSDVLDKLGDMENAVQQTIRIFDLAKVYEMLGVEELSYIDVAKTLGEAVSLFSGSIDVKVLNECHGLAVLADSLLRQLFYNLIDNSLKYGKKVSTVRVYYEKAGQDRLMLLYEDDGVGIPIGDKSKLFKQGYSTGGSTGYGLFMIKKMMEVYGWTIQETGTPGKGAQFTITIPKTNRNGKGNYHFTDTCQVTCANACWRCELAKASAEFADKPLRES